MQLTTAQSTPRQTHRRTLVPGLRPGTHCNRGSATTQSTQLRCKAINRPTGTTTTPAPTYDTLRFAQPHRTTTAPTPKRPPQKATAQTTTSSTTTTNLGSVQTIRSLPQIKQKSPPPARIIYITLLRILVATIGYIHRLYQRPPSYHGRSTSTTTHRNHAYNTSSTAPSHRNHPLRSVPKTKTYNYDGNQYNYDAIHNLRQRPYEIKEQSSPTRLNDMSQYRGYFVPGSVDPTGACEAECTLGKAINHKAVGIDFQRTDIAAPPSTGDWAESNVLLLELSTKVLNAANIANAAAQKDALAGVTEAIDVLALPSAKDALEGLETIWKNKTSKNVFRVNIWIRVEAECCTDAWFYWNSNYYKKTVDWVNTGVQVDVEGKLPIKKLMRAAIHHTQSAFQKFSCKTGIQ